MPVCPQGHHSNEADFCDVCGRPIGAEPTPVPASEQLPSPLLSCPNCDTMNATDALFCESCGFDFTTGTLPDPDASPGIPTLDQPATPAAPHPPVEWIAELWIDPDWYAAQGSPDPMPSPGLPDIVPLVKSEHLIGRVSHSRGIFPEIDCELDTGCSRRHAMLSTDGSRWWIEDLGSANGTFVGAAAGPLPAMPIPQGRVELGSGQRIYLGAWTRIVVRRATADETEAFGT